MTQRNDISTLKTAARYIRLYGGWDLLRLTYVAVLTFLVINCTVFVIHNWTDVQQRIEGFNGLVKYALYAIYFVGYVFKIDKLVLLTGVIDEGFHPFPFRTSEERLKVRKSINDNLVQLNTIWYYGLIGVFGVLTGGSVVAFAFQLIQHNIEDIKVESLHTPFTFYYPKDHETLSVYLLARTLQTYFCFYGMIVTYVILVSVIACVQILEGELKLLRLSIQEMDQIINDIQEGLKHTGMEHKRNNSAIQLFVAYFVKHHECIYRKAQIINKGVHLAALSMSAGTAILMCVSLFNLLKAEGFVIQVQEVSLILVLILWDYCFNNVGENVITESNILRNALYESTWIDKPLWFKKSLNLMMTRTIIPIEMKDTGLFSLNLESFGLTVRAAYTYYSLLCSLQK